MNNPGPRGTRLLALSAVVALGLVSSEAAARGPAIGFEPNLGQTDSRVEFLARGRRFVLFLTPREAVFSLPGRDAEALRMRLVGASGSVAIAGRDPLPGRSHYYLGSDPARWLRDVPSYEKVEYRGIYPGVDLVFYESDGELEYDFLVAPGADPRKIELALTGVSEPRLDGSGNLILFARGRQLVWRKPVVYQVFAGERRTVAGRYALRGKRRVGFEVARYDKGRPLVIDPTLSASTYLGGSDADAAHGVASDSAGNVYVTGETLSSNFPVTSGTPGGAGDAFVTKFNPSGSTRLYSVYLGGNNLDIGHGIAVDAAGNAHIAGQTSSGNFPTTVGGYDRTKGNGVDGFVTKLTATGGLTYSTFLGGSGMDQGDRASAIALDSAGNMVVTGRTDSDDFPVKATVFPFNTFHGFTFDAFVAKLNPAASGGASLIYSAYLGGSLEDAGLGIALDAAGNPHIAGGTNSSDFPVLGSAYQGTNTAGSTDAFFIKLNATATAVLYATYLGGSASQERAGGIALDPSGNAYITGLTPSADFPVKNPLQALPGGLADAFVAKFNPAASGNASLVYATYLGGSGNEQGHSIAVDASGRAYVTGQTASPLNFPRVNATQSVFGGGTQDGFVTKFNASGSAHVYSTFLGGSGDEGVAPTGEPHGHGIATAPCGDAWVTGRTLSTNFPTVNPAQPAAGGLGDAFVTKIADPDPPTVSGAVPRWGPTAGGTVVTIVGDCFRAGATVTIGGSAATGVTVLSATAITATAPAHAAGAVNVVVTNPGSPPATLVNGFTYGATGFFTLTPCRVLDTRGSNGPLGGPALVANGDRTFTLTGNCGIPAAAKALSANITVTQPTAQGDLRLYPGGTPLPFVSSINYRPGQTRANNAVISLGPGGTIAVRCDQAAGTVHFLLDVNGYFQ